MAFRTRPSMPCTAAGCEAMYSSTDLKSVLAIAHSSLVARLECPIGAGTSSRVLRDYLTNPGCGREKIRSPAESVSIDRSARRTHNALSAAEKAGDPVRMPTTEGAGPFDGINPPTAAWETGIGRGGSAL